MSKDERKEMIENIAERFTQMDDVDKSYIAGYMAGKQEERQKWEQQFHVCLHEIPVCRNDVNVTVLCGSYQVRCPV